MDDLVLKGMAKWPNVPAVYGWLALDRRGAWLLKGERIGNAAVTAFIGRNYARDDRGRWFFQNGPQRVYVTLHYTPFVYRVSRAAGRLALQSHTGCRARRASGAWLDEAGVVLVDTELGPGVVHDHDLTLMREALVDARGNTLEDDALAVRIDQLQQHGASDLCLRLDTLIPVHAIRSNEVAQRFAFDPDPREESASAANAPA